MFFVTISYFLSRALKKNEDTSPNRIAAVIPADEAVSPPFRIHRNPSSETAFFTPSARRCPNPNNGTLAPAPAKSTIY